MTHYANPPQPSQPPYYPPPPPRKTNRTAWVVLIVALVVAGLLLLCGIVAALTSSKPQPAATGQIEGQAQPTITVTTPAAQSPTAAAAKTTGPPPPPPPVTITGTGTFLVPDEVKPGTYRTKVPADGPGCYWARLKGTSGGLEDIIASDIQDAGATVVVTIKATDKAFKVDNECGTWTKIK